LSFPYLAPVLDKEVFEKYDYIGAMEAISDFSKKIIALGIDKVYTDAVAHGLYYAVKYGGELDLQQNQLEDILKLDDCLSTVLLLEYSIKHNIEHIAKAIKNVQMISNPKGKEKSIGNGFWHIRLGPKRK